jgi:Agrobacterium tumefaciens protein Atu4866
MALKRYLVLSSLAVLAAVFTDATTIAATREMFLAQSGQGGQMVTHRYVGMWVTGDGQIRQELLASGRYDEARGSRKSAYQGRYEIRGNEIFYWDDKGFTADGRFVSDDELHHGGMIFYREKR